MPSYKFRAEPVDAMFFDGSEVGAEAVVSWLEQVLPELVVRRRVEYKGWGDRIGHLELEIRDLEVQTISGDWIVVEHGEASPRVRIYDSAAFERRFEIDLR